jgi:hypothetical protein
VDVIDMVEVELGVDDARALLSYLTAGVVLPKALAARIADAIVKAMGE